MKIEIQTPFVVHAPDYHAFSDYQDTLKKITGVNLKFTEFSPRDYPGNYCYAAVFYVRGEALQARQLIKEQEEQEEQED